MGGRDVGGLTLLKLFSNPAPTVLKQHAFIFLQMHKMAFAFKNDSQ
jgi:hypothetical protein